jgi:prepilin-type processing-associated H-X9-DG protein/prepilin-type N-terminal cleavage/methylation domain-containing protein
MSNLPAPLRARARARAFTLVELLVVIGIIALLIAILMPALSKARKQAQITQCLSNARNMAQAAVIHAAEHRGYLPLGGLLHECGDARPELVGDRERKKYTYYDDAGTMRVAPLTAALAQYMNLRVNLNNRAEMEKALSTGDYRKAFLCPSHENPEAGITVCGFTPYNEPNVPREYVSYVFNEAVIGRRENWHPAGPGMTPRGLVGKVRRSSEVMLFADGLPRTVNNYYTIFDHDVNWTLLDYYNRQHVPNNWRTFDYKRHDNRMNVVFVDGHAETVGMKDPDFKKIGVSWGIYQ